MRATWVTRTATAGPPPRPRPPPGPAAPCPGGLPPQAAMARRRHPVRIQPRGTARQTARPGRATKGVAGWVFRDVKKRPPKSHENDTRGAAFLYDTDCLGVSPRSGSRRTCSVPLERGGTATQAPGSAEKRDIRPGKKCAEQHGVEIRPVAGTDSMPQLAPIRHRP